MPDDLRRIHEDLLSALAALETLVAAAPPDRARLADARWKLTRVSMRRTRTTEELRPRLLAHASPEEARKLDELRALHAEQRAASTRHINRWTLDTIAAEWDEYRAASAAMTASMRARIAIERELLYPLLDRVQADERQENQRPSALRNR